MDEMEQSHGIALDSNENIYVIGEIKSTPADVINPVLIKFNSDGTEQWNRLRILVFSPY